MPPPPGTADMSSCCTFDGVTPTQRESAPQNTVFTYVTDRGVLAQREARPTEDPAGASRGGSPRARQFSGLGWFPISHQGRTPASITAYGFVLKGSSPDSAWIFGTGLQMPGPHRITAATQHPRVQGH